MVYMPRKASGSDKKRTRSFQKDQQQEDKKKTWMWTKNLFPSHLPIAMTNFFPTVKYTIEQHMVSWWHAKIFEIKKKFSGIEKSTLSSASQLQ